jgi:hypothetical protein
MKKILAKAYDLSDSEMMLEMPESCWHEILLQGNDS